MSPPFVTTRPFSPRNNPVCRRFRDRANYRNIKVTWQKNGGIVCLLWRIKRWIFSLRSKKMRFIWNRVNNQILGEIRLDLNPLKRRNICTRNNFLKKNFYWSVYDRGYFSEIWRSSYEWYHPHPTIRPMGIRVRIHVVPQNSLLVQKGALIQKKEKT